MAAMFAATSSQWQQTQEQMSQCVDRPSLSRSSATLAPPLGIRLTSPSSSSRAQRSVHSSTRARRSTSSSSTSRRRRRRRPWWTRRSGRAAQLPRHAAQGPSSRLHLLPLRPKRCVLVILSFSRFGRAELTSSSSRARRSLDPGLPQEQRPGVRQPASDQAHDGHPQELPHRGRRALAGRRRGRGRPGRQGRRHGDRRRRLRCCSTRQVRLPLALYFSSATMLETRA